ncbi:HvfC/BufC N-terminal domain-containing protein [Kaarinaea lacus]
MSQTKRIPPQAPDDLRQLQANFKSYLFDENPAICTSISGTSDEHRESRLKIYQNAYYLRLIESLQQDYEALYTVLGEEEFTQLMLAYIRNHPSTFTSLRHYGHLLTDYIQQSKYFKDREYVAELAQLQWLLIEAFDAIDQKIIVEQDLTLIPPLQWPEMKLTFHPSVRHLYCQWNSVDIYAAAKSKAPIPAAILLENPVTVLIWRHNLITRYRTLETDESRLFLLAIAGANFAELCGQLGQESSDLQENAMRAARLLKTWIQDGLVVNVDYSND